jgi:hypothetical protein
MAPGTVKTVDPENGHDGNTSGLKGIHWIRWQLQAPMNGLRWSNVDEDDGEVVGASRHCQVLREIGPSLSDQGLAQRQTSVHAPLRKALVMGATTHGREGHPGSGCSVRGSLGLGFEPVRIEI